MRGLRPLLLISIPILAVLVTLLIMIKIIGTGDTTGGNKDLFKSHVPLHPTATVASPTATWDSGFGTTPRAWHTVTPEPLAVAGRSDCPASWVAYEDPKDRFSICYPTEFTAAASESSLNVRSPRTVGQLENLVGVIVSWDIESEFREEPPGPDACTDNTGVVGGAISSTMQAVPLIGLTAPACLTIGRSISSSLHGSVPLAMDGSAKNGFIRFMVNFTGPDLSSVPSIGQAILKTLDIRFR